MAENDRAKTGLAAGGGAALGAAAAVLLARKVEAAPPEGEVSLDEAAMLLLRSIAESGVAIDDNTFKALAELAGLRGSIDALAAALGVIVLQNPAEITSFRILVPVVNVPVQLPDREIPYGMEFVIKALPTNRGVIWVANSRHEALNINSVYQIIANEAIEYKIRNPHQLWLNTTRAGEGVVCTVEQKGRGAA